MIHLPIDEMLAGIPLDFADLRARLLALKQSCRYTAPEMMGYRALQLNAIIDDELKPATRETAWARAVLALHAGPMRN